MLKRYSVQNFKAIGNEVMTDIMDKDWGLAFADGLSAEQRRLVERVVGLIGVSDAQSWFSRPNLHLDGAAPVDLLAKVEGRALLDAYLLSLKDGNYL